MAWSDGNRDGDERDRVANDDGQEPYGLGLTDDEDERLPWLESGDDFEDDNPSDGGRMLGFALLGLVALAAIVGAIWWSTHQTSDAAKVADGSTIAAPGPYKEAPKNAGGKTFEGTGDTAFAVSEGQSRPARLGEEGAAAAVAASDSPSASAAPRPGFSLAPKQAPAASPAASPAPAPAPAAASGTLVQVGAYSNRTQAQAGWTKLSGQYSALSGLRHQIVEGQADIGTVFRLQALAGSGEAARALCGKLKAAGLACQVK